MIDFAKITVKAGDGGRGSGSRAQIKGKRYNRADGGDGGRGGNVIFEATNDARGLEAYRYEHFFKAQDGKMGLSNLRRGANGSDLVLKVPTGTLIKVSGATEESKDNSMFYDLTELGQKALVARGGDGGKGNAHLRDEFGRRPKVGEPGEVGEKLDLTLELKLIADVGLIGLPNAGKSTLLSRLTAASPKIASYPFTTLEANLGVMKKSITSSHGATSTTGFDSSRDTRDTLNYRDTLVLADIPGLIEGASEGRGLGDLFLRHIERTKMLVHLIDITGDDLWRDYHVIRSELKSYSKELAKKKEIIVLNKVDLASEQQVRLAVEEFKKHRKKVFLISAEKREGLDELVGEIYKRLR